jgi:hypothetical protein
METTRLRITSDGTPKGTRVTTEDGKLVRGVQMVNWHLGVGGLAKAYVEFAGIAVDVVGGSDAEIHPSFIHDPDLQVVLTDPQAPPQGPGFVTDETYIEATHVCPECQALYDDEDQVCCGDDIRGEHQPTPVQPLPPQGGRITEEEIRGE